MRVLAPDELKERATHRRKHSPCGIGAAFEADITEPDRDGRLFSVVVTDTIHGVGRVEVGAPRVAHDREIETEAIEEFVEQEAGRFPLETRMRDLLAASPLRIELYLSE